MTAVFWTATVDTHLRTLFAERLGDEDIGTRIGTSARAVKRRRQQLGLLYRPRRIPKPEVKPREALAERNRRQATVITRVIARVPSCVALGDVVTVKGRELVVIDWNPDGDLVTVDQMTRDVIVVGEVGR